MDEFAERLQAAMVQRGITSAELARQVGVARSAVSGWLGDKRPSRRNVQEVAEALSVSAAWLEHGTGEGPEADRDPTAERESLFWWMRRQSPDGQRVLGEAAS